MEHTKLDSAIKFGAGRYRQGRRLLEESGEEIRRFGKRVFLVAGDTAFQAVERRLLTSLELAGVEYVVEIYHGTCSYEAAQEYAKKCLADGCDEVVGVGGGKIMDFAKAVGEMAGLGVVNIPTSAATCAAFTSMSVMYTASGAYRDSWRFEHEVDAVLVDLDIIAECPPRYAAAGMIDAMAKWIEIQNGRSGLNPDDTDYDLYTAFRMAEYVYETLVHFGTQAVRDIGQHRVTRAVEYAVFLSIAVTGNIANITRSFRQSALAHMFYYGIRTYYTEEAKAALHGEIVGVGLFLQLFYNQMGQEAKRLAGFMKGIGMPLMPEEIGVTATQETFELLERYLADSPHVEQSEQGIRRLHEAMKVFLPTLLEMEEGFPYNE